MNLQQIDSIFSLIDIDKTGEIDQGEWKSYEKTFLTPFLNCAKDWAVDPTNIDCFLKEKWAQNIFYQEETPEIDLKTIFKQSVISFSDYMFIRKSANAFFHCNPSGQMTIKGVRCGIMRVQGLPYVNPGELKTV